MWKKASATKYVGQSEGELGPVLSRSCRSVRSEMMTYYQTSRRRGVTILEVLVSIFVLLIGVTGVIALFPVGVRLSQQAADDVLSAMTAQNALAAVLAEPGLRARCRAYDPDTNPTGDVTGWDGSTLKGLDGISSDINIVAPEGNVNQIDVVTLPIVRNGGFKAPSVGTGWMFTSGYEGYDGQQMTAAQLTAFAWEGGNLVVSGNNNTWKGPNNNVGAQFAALQQTRNMTQSISGFQVGQTYQFSFREASRLNHADGPTALTVSIDGVTPALYTRGQTASDLSWTARTTNSFVATQNTHVLRLATTATTHMYTTLIDDVRISGVGQVLFPDVHTDGGSTGDLALMQMLSGQALNKIYRVRKASDPTKPVVELAGGANLPFDGVKAGDGFRLLGARDTNNAWATVPANFYEGAGGGSPPFHLGRGAVEGYGYLAVVTRLEGQDDTFRVDILVYKGYNSTLPPEANLPPVAVFSTIVSGDMLNNN